jgi:hypothetical protein
VHQWGFACFIGGGMTAAGVEQLLDFLGITRLGGGE